MAVEGRCIRNALTNYILFSEMIALRMHDIEQAQAELDDVEIQGIGYEDKPHILNPESTESRIIRLVALQEEARKDIVAYKRLLDIVDEFIESLEYADKKLVCGRYLYGMDEVTLERYAGDNGYSESGMVKRVRSLINEYCRKKRKTVPRGTS